MPKRETESEIHSRGDENIEPEGFIHSSSPVTITHLSLSLDRRTAAKTLFPSNEESQHCAGYQVRRLTPPLS
jgi:hypothetical protein